MLLGVPDAATASRWAERDDVETVVWRPGEAPLGRTIDLLVLPYLAPAADLAGLAGQPVRVLQSPMLGHDGVADHLPSGYLYCNAVGVHEAPTAELAVALLLADRRGLAEAARASGWDHARHPGLAGQRVLILGAGGVARELVRRLEPFEVALTRVGRTARDGVHGVDELAGLLPEHDAVVLAVPLDDSTRGLVDDAFLARMRDGAVLVNVARGPVVDTDALVAHLRTGRIRAALDVTDPEPLPAGHPLWSTPGTLVTPHVGGDVGSMATRLDAVVDEQLRRLAAGEPPAHVVHDTR